MAENINAHYIREASKKLVESNEELIRSGYLDIEDLYKNLTQLQLEKDRALAGLRALALEDSQNFGQITSECSRHTSNLHLNCNERPGSVLSTPTGI